MDDYKQTILEFAESSKKSKFYFSDLEQAVKAKFPDAKTREIKKAATELVNTEKLIYFSTGPGNAFRKLEIMPSASCSVIPRR